VSILFIFDGIDKHIQFFLFNLLFVKQFYE
jgi:hypothetical protein